MAITQTDVKYIANLARLALTDAEIDHFQDQLEGILGYIDQLKQLDVTNVEPMAQVLDSKNVTREDKIKKSLDVAEFIKTTPSHSGNFFKVPKVIE